MANSFYHCLLLTLAIIYFLPVGLLIMSFTDQPSTGNLIILFPTSDFHLSNPSNIALLIKEDTHISAHSLYYSLSLSRTLVRARLCTKGQTFLSDGHCIFPSLLLYFRLSLFLGFFFFFFFFLSAIRAPEKKMPGCVMEEFISDARMLDGGIRIGCP